MHAPEVVAWEVDHPDKQSELCLLRRPKSLYPLRFRLISKKNDSTLASPSLRQLVIYTPQQESSAATWPSPPEHLVFMQH